MPNKSEFLDALRLLVGRAEIEESDRERYLSLLTEARFATIELDDLSKIAQVIETEKAEIEREIAESADPDMINEMSDLVEALDKIDYDAAVQALKDGGVSTDDAGLLKKSGQWLLDKFAGLVQ